MNIIKRIVWVILSLLSFLSAVQINVSAEEENAPVYAERLNDGTYEIEVKSSSSMFRIVHCTLTVNGEEMTACMTLSGKGYEKLFMGKGAEADSAGEERFIYFTENADGKYDYTVPVSALDTEIDCAAWSIKKEKWYDRTLIFKSDTLPENAFAKEKNFIYVIIIAVIIAAVIGVAVCAVKRKK